MGKKKKACQKVHYLKPAFWLNRQFKGLKEITLRLKHLTLGGLRFWVEDHKLEILLSFEVPKLSHLCIKLYSVSVLTSIRSCNIFPPQDFIFN